MKFASFTPQQDEVWMQKNDKEGEVAYLVYRNFETGKLMRTCFGGRLSQAVGEDMINGQNGWIRVVPRGDLPQV